ncbi:MAG: hypothetical protein JOY59_07075, partial [Candidatus Eremiobacteraeota bacterium]|nr:hypothetical protein [Candidatus Eremiobacteraeota bacterium]
MTCTALVCLPLAGRSALSRTTLQPAAAAHQRVPASLRDRSRNLALAGGIADPFARPLPEAPAAAVMAPSAKGRRPGVREPSAALRAVVIGETALALIDDGGRSRGVAVGESVGDQHVVRIDATGVALSDGRRLTL